MLSVMSKISVMEGAIRTGHSILVASYRFAPRCLENSCREQIGPSAGSALPDRCGCGRSRGVRRALHVDRDAQSLTFSLRIVILAGRPRAALPSLQFLP